MRIHVTIDLDELADRLATPDPDEEEAPPVKGRGIKRRKHTEKDIASFRRGKKNAEVEEAAASIEEVLEEKSKSGREKWAKVLAEE
jgi:hypothetical protein